jgi:hypothetical protein
MGTAARDRPTSDHEQFARDDRAVGKVSPNL